MLASYVAFDPAGRLAAAWERLAAVGPYALVALAVLNLVRSVVRSIAAFLAPAALGATAAAFFVRPSVPPAHLRDALAVAAVFAASALVLSAFPERGSWIRLLWTGRAHGPARLTGCLRATVVLGELRLDLLSSAVDGRATLTVVTLVGRVVVEVPQHRRIVVRPPRRLLLAVWERGRRDQIPAGEPELELRLLGAVGTLELERT